MSDYKPYVEYAPDGRTITRVLCKLCRVEIRGMVEDPRYPRMYLSCHSNYVEVTLCFDDGSRHVTPLCKTCASTLKVADLAGLYAADLNEMQREKATPIALIARLAKRKPTAAVSEG